MSNPLDYAPYTFTQHASITERVLPVVNGRLEINAVDHTKDDPTEVLEQVNMILDTGGHRTILTEDLLSE